MNLVQWIQARQTRKRLEKLGQPPFSVEEYQRTTNFLRMLQRHADAMIDPDHVLNYRFRLREGEWPFTGSRRELEARFTAMITDHDDYWARVNAFWAEKKKREYLRYQRAEIRHARWRRAIDITGWVLLFSAQAIGVVLLVTLALCLMFIPDLAIGVVGMTVLLDKTVRDIERF
jgi:hypothetical protein